MGTRKTKWLERGTVRVIAEKAGVNEGYLLDTKRGRTCDGAYAYNVKSKLGNCGLGHKQILSIFRQVKIIT